MSNRDTSIDSRLIESARKEFIEKGFIKAELKTICENANITTGAVYKRYKGKEELFRAVVEKAVATLDSFVSERTDVDFSSMSDEEVRNTWTMNEEYILAVSKSYGIFEKNLYYFWKNLPGQCLKTSGMILLFA